MNIDDVTIGQMVVLPSDEHGRVSRIDHDDHVVYVDVAIATGIDTIDIDPDEIRPVD